MAEQAGISASYLNLIEHNRRRIGGKLLSDLARILSVDPSLLTEGADSDLLDQMRAAAGIADHTVEIARAEEMAARYPGWSNLIAAQARRLAVLDDRLQTLNDRMAHDPKLANALHDVISAVTAIRSTSSILIGQEELDADWQRRFHQNIHTDSVRLAASSEALITYLEMPDADPDVATTPSEQMERYLGTTGYHLAPLEDHSADLADLCAASGLTDAALQLFSGFAQQYRADAKVMPLAAFTAACAACHYDPLVLAAQFNVTLDVVLRRLASLPRGAGHPPMGLMICDNSGTTIFNKSVPGFAAPRTGGACPLWPVFGALSRPAQPIRQDVTLPGLPAPRFLCYAIALPVAAPRFDAPPVLHSTMLVMPDPPQGTAPPQEVGISCRICARYNCQSRREPAIDGVAGQSDL